MPTENLRTLYERILEEIYHAGNLDAAEDYFAPNYVSHINSRTSRGIEVVKKGAAALRSAFPDCRFTVEDALAIEDRLVVRWTFRGTNLGVYPGLGIPATGKQIEFWGIEIDRFAGGKLMEAWASFDMLGALQQAGVIPASHLSPA